MIHLNWRVPCKHCVYGIILRFERNGEKGETHVTHDTCPCCEGSYENCPTCAEEKGLVEIEDATSEIW